MIYNCRNNEYFFEDSGFYVIIINVDCQSNPGSPEMPLPSCVNFNTTFQGLCCCNMRVKLNDAKSHFELQNSMVAWIWTILSFCRLITSCFNKCQCLPVFSKTYIKAQNINPASGNLPLWRSWHLPTVSWSVFWQFWFLEPWSLEVFILRESVEMF